MTDEEELECPHKERFAGSNANSANSPVQMNGVVVASGKP